MSRSVYVASPEGLTGKSAVALGLLDALGIAWEIEGPAELPVQVDPLLLVDTALTPEIEAALRAAGLALAAAPDRSAGVEVVCFARASTHVHG